MKDTVEGTSLVYQIIALSQSFMYIYFQEPSSAVSNFSKTMTRYVFMLLGFRLLSRTNYPETAQRVRR